VGPRVVESLHAVTVSLDDAMRCDPIVRTKGANAVLEFALDFAEGCWIACT
jgi:hypothetical protein